jgi:hypothetical protein
VTSPEGGLKRRLVVWLLVAGAWLASPAIVAAQVDLKIVDGRVWLVATNATVAQILNEWTRIGGTQVVNAERVPGAPLTLELSDVSEQEALDVVLQSAAGFMAVRRAAPVIAMSSFDRILILPVSTVSLDPPPAPSRGETAPPPVFAEPPMPLPPGADPVQPVIGADGRPVPDDQQDANGLQGQPPLAMPTPPGLSPPAVSVPPYPEAPAEPAASPGVSVPGQPVGVPVPGMVPAPPDPNRTPAQR